ncbi:hypothetical protein ACFWXH_22915 [Mesorhizobium sp. NPDC059054]|uniref:hypothetical protein n=1 Tax=Mesorhizobium sp. NPDC059054 TaxID=3346711 RepID=UPI003692655C
MQEFDFYTNTEKPTLGIYVRKGAGLPDLLDAGQWSLDGTVGQNELSPEILKQVEADGHAFQELGDG